jgi:hypothetical protein
MQKSLKTMVAVGAVALVAAGQAQAGCQLRDAQNSAKKQEVKDQKHEKRTNASFKSSLLKDGKGTDVKAAWEACSNKEWQGE